MKFALIAAALILPLAACASGGSMDDPVFKAGYEAGCGMAHASREARAAMTEGQPDLYKRGFSAGFTACGGGREPGQ
ncbi:MAG: hypothetical protein QM698_05245 [Micropepsaceae bacterium]